MKLSARMVASLSIAALTLPVQAAQPLRTVAAEGAWATFATGDTCQAMTAALLPARKGKVQARITVAFDARPGGRRGEVAVRLNRPARTASTVMLTVNKEPFLLAGRGDVAWSRGPAQEAAIIAAMRRGGGMRAEARDGRGGRIVDRYDLTGAATAIDAAAACSVSLEKR
jgi:hypothetical protein